MPAQLTGGLQPLLTRGATFADNEAMESTPIQTKYQVRRQEQRGTPATVTETAVHECANREEARTWIRKQDGGSYTVVEVLTS